MAATSVYTNICRIPASSVPTENVAFSNINASSASFMLRGGKYGMTCKASTYGTVTLQVQANDGTTWLTALTAFAADGYATVDLPPGTFKISLA
jgi:hypothetical protein